MTRVKVRGLAVIDMRTSAARELMRWKAELLRDLGGEENISTQRLALVDMAVRTRLFLSHIDAFLLAQSSLVNKRHRTVLPILRDRMTLSDQLARLLSQLGLDRADAPGSRPCEVRRGKVEGEIVNILEAMTDQELFGKTFKRGCCVVIAGELGARS